MAPGLLLDPTCTLLGTTGNTDPLVLDLALRAGGGVLFGLLLVRNRRAARSGGQAESPAAAEAA